MRYRKYPSYHDSGVAWLGEVPEHWISIKFKQAFIHKSKTTNHRLNCGSISFGVVVYKDNDKIPVETRASYQEVLAGEFLINPLNLNFDLKSLRTALSTLDVVVSTGYIVLQSKPNLNKNYLRWLLYQFDVAHMKTLGAGVRQTVNFTDIGNEYFQMPTTQEQKSIATFLDTATAKIDSLIEKETRLIALLKEKRQALISHAVTRGLDKSAKMKDSGVAWLGEIPEGWICSKFGFLKTVLTDYTANGSFADLAKYVTYRDEEDYARLVRLTDLRKNLQNKQGVWIDIDSYKFLRKSALFGGEFLMANVGAYAGLFYQMPYINKPASLAPNMFMVKFNTEKVSKEYMAYIGISDSAHKQLRLKATSSSAQPKLNKDDFKSIIFVYPLLPEQQEIVNYLDKKTIMIDTLISKATQAITLLKEKRTALISAAVTGKIDVREINEKDS